MQTPEKLSKESNSTSLPGKWKRFDKETYKKVILNYFAERNMYVSFAEIIRCCKNAGLPTRGYCAMESSIPNIFYWAGTTEEIVNTIVDLVSEKIIRFEPSSLLLYLIDGSSLMMPIAKRPPEKGYKDPHWFPVTMCLTLEGIRKLKDKIIKGPSIKKGKK